MKKSAKVLLGVAGAFFGTGLLMNTMVLTRASKKISEKKDAIEEKNGKKKVVQRKMFPTYVLLKMRYTDNLWHTIVNTRGVTGFVGPAGRPLPLTDDEVRKMRLEKIVVDLKVEVGNKVKVISGPLEGFVGDVLAVDADEQKCKVSVEMFGRQTPVDLDFVQIEIM